ncbi:MAG TPA: diacylglycerol kinase family protein [Polyangiaceae bacterium]|nr:diacylglycerol kinase family protein [Polyangiaceae bacterium]
MTPPLRVLVNPKAGAGRALRQLPTLEKALGRRGLAYDVVRTGGPGQAARLVREAAEAGVETLLVLGGDGTLHEVVQAYVDAEGRPLAGPAVLPFAVGTGCDYRRTFGVPDGVEAALGLLAEGRAAPVDLGLAHVTDHQGRPGRHVFVNITSFGVGGLADRYVNRAPKWLGGRLSFFLATTAALARYRNARMAVSVDGAEIYRGPAFNTAVALGRYFGGGMHIAPHADPGDGRFDVVVLGDLRKRDVVAMTRDVYRGAHLGRPNIVSARGRRVEAEPVGGDEALIDMDGETPGRLPMRLEVVPGALRVWRAAGA